MVFEPIFLVFEAERSIGTRKFSFRWDCHFTRTGILFDDDVDEEEEEEEDDYSVNVVIIL